MERMVRVANHYRLWVREHGAEDAAPVLLIMGANASGLTWPEPFVRDLAENYRVIQYDHRDTGRSTWAFDQHPYAIRELAAGAVAVLDSLGIDRAHVVGMSMGAMLTQLLLLDHPHRLRSATMLCGAPMGTGEDSAQPLSDVHPELLALWAEMAEEREYDAEIVWRVNHWRILNGNVLAFEPETFRAMEERVIAHAGTHRNPAAHVRADPAGLDRGAELARVTVPTLVIDGPEDPVSPPPQGRRLAMLLGRTQRIDIPGMGHALNTPILEPLADAIRAHAQAADSR